MLFEKACLYAAPKDDATDMFEVFFSKASMAMFLCMAVFGAALNSCKKPAPPPPDVQARYQNHAETFCKAITACIEEAVKERLKDEPQRRDMVLERMNRELCRKNQFRLLASLEADPRGPQPPSSKPALYASYGRCAEKLKAAPNCQKVREIYDADMDCRRVRSPHK